MQFMEKDLEKVIFEGCRETMFKRYGFYKPRLLKRQLKIGNYGIADIVGFEMSWSDEKKILVPEVTIYELKQDKVSVSAFIQACRYAKGIEHFMLKKKSKYHKDLKFNIVLIGKSVDDDGDFVYLPDIIFGERINFSIYTYDYCLDGLYMRSHGFYYKKFPGF